MEIVRDWFCIERLARRAVSEVICVVMGRARHAAVIALRVSNLGGIVFVLAPLSQFGLMWLCRVEKLAKHAIDRRSPMNFFGPGALDPP